MVVVVHAPFSLDGRQFKRGDALTGPDADAVLASSVPKNAYVAVNEMLVPQAAPATPAQEPVPASEQESD